MLDAEKLLQHPTILLRCYRSIIGTAKPDLHPIEPLHNYIVTPASGKYKTEFAERGVQSLFGLCQLADKGTALRFPERFIKKSTLKSRYISIMKIKIDGMSCNHCKMAVEKALAKISGIKSYSVDLEKGEANIAGNPDQQLVVDAINKLGYQATLAD